MNRTKRGWAYVPYAVDITQYLKRHAVMYRSSQVDGFGGILALDCSQCHHKADVVACLEATCWVAADLQYFRDGVSCRSYRRNADDNGGRGHTLGGAGGRGVRGGTYLPGWTKRCLTAPNDLTVHLVCIHPDWQGRIHRLHGQLGCQPRLVDLWSCRRGRSHHDEHAAHPSAHEQHTGRGNLPAAQLDGVRHL